MDECLDVDVCIDIDLKEEETAESSLYIQSLYVKCFYGNYQPFVSELLCLGKTSLLARAFVFRINLYGMLMIQRNEAVARKLAISVLPWAQYHVSAETSVVAIAELILADCYKKGILLDVNLVTAFEIYHRGALRGYGPCQNNLGICFSEGEGTVIDKVEAIRWYKLAAEQGYANAMDNLGNILYDSNSPQIEEAVNWFRSAADLGYIRSINTLAGLYLDGIEIEENNGEAIRLLRKGAEYGSSTSHYFLSFCYQHGRGVDVDLATSIWHLKQSAYLEDEDGMCRYGAHLLYGLNANDYRRGRFHCVIYDTEDDISHYDLLSPNEEEGLPHLHLAASRKSVIAFQFLAQYYYECKNDYMTAYRWLKYGCTLTQSSGELFYLLGLLHYHRIVSTFCFNQSKELTREELLLLPTRVKGTCSLQDNFDVTCFPHDPRQGLSRSEELKRAARYFHLASTLKCDNASVYLFWMLTQGDTIDETAIRFSRSTVSTSVCEKSKQLDFMANVEDEPDLQLYDVEMDPAHPLAWKEERIFNLLSSDSLKSRKDVHYLAHISYQLLKAYRNNGAKSDPLYGSLSSDIDNILSTRTGFASPLSLSPLNSSAVASAAVRTARIEKSSERKITTRTLHHCLNLDIEHVESIFSSLEPDDFSLHTSNHLAVQYSLPGSNQDLRKVASYFGAFCDKYDGMYQYSTEGDANGDETGEFGLFLLQKRCKHRYKIRQRCSQQYMLSHNNPEERTLLSQNDLDRVDNSILPLLSIEQLPILERLEIEAEGLCNVGLAYYYGLFGLPNTNEVNSSKSRPVQGDYWRQNYADISPTASNLFTAGSDITTGLSIKTDAQRQTEIHRAITCFQRSATFGNARAQYCLGWCYRWGEGVVRNREKAVELFSESARQGYAQAQFQLGLCFLKGKGVEKVDEKEGLYWIRCSAAQDYFEAVDYRRRFDHKKVVA